VEEAAARAAADHDPMEGKTLEEIEELEEEDEYADSHFLEKYREERLAAIRAAREKAKFGDVRAGARGAQGVWARGCVLGVACMRLGSRQPRCAWSAVASLGCAAPGHR
jgi:hypothetical protein